MRIELRRLQNRLRVASLALAGMLVACATAQAQDPVTADRELLVEGYIAALNECDSDKLGGLLHPEHKGFLIRGGVGDGMGNCSDPHLPASGKAFKYQETQPCKVTDKVQGKNMDERGWGGNDWDVGDGGGDCSDP